MFHLYRDQPVDMSCRPITWFLFEWITSPNRIELHMGKLSCMWTSQKIANRKVDFLIIWDALRDLVPFVQFRRSTFSKGNSSKLY